MEPPKVYKMGRQRGSCRCRLAHPHGSVVEARDCNRFGRRKKASKIKDFKWQDSVWLPSLRKFWKVDFRVDEHLEVVWHESKCLGRLDRNTIEKLIAFRIDYPNRKIYVSGRLIDFIPRGLLSSQKPKFKKVWPKVKYCRITKRYIPREKENL